MDRWTTRTRRATTRGQEESSSGGGAAEDIPDSTDQSGSEENVAEEESEWEDQSEAEEEDEESDYSDSSFEDSRVAPKGKKSVNKSKIGTGNPSDQGRKKRAELKRPAESSSSESDDDEGGTFMVSHKRRKSRAPVALRRLKGTASNQAAPKSGLVGLQANMKASDKPPRKKRKRSEAKKEKQSPKTKESECIDDDDGENSGRVSDETSSSSKGSKVSKATEKKRSKTAGTVADIGLILPPHSSAYLTCDSLMGMLRAVNITDGEVRLTPAARSQSRLGRSNIDGDDLPNHLPVGWGRSDEVRFEVIRINSDLLPGAPRELEAECLERIMGGRRRWTMEELMGMVTPAPGSENKAGGGDKYTHYLGYRRSIWKALPQNQIQETNVRAHIILDVGRGRALKEPYDCEPNEKAIVVDKALHGVNVAFVVPKDSDTGAPPPTGTLDPFMKSIGTSGCISFLQKVVRRRPSLLRHPDSGEVFEPPVVLRAIVRRLLDPRQPGIFLPDQGIYVSARQHLLKRLLVIMAEDSEYSDETACLLACSALLSECEASWEPSSVLKQQWEEVAVALWRSPVASYYDTNKGYLLGPSSPCPFHPTNFPSLVLEELGGMRGDIGMMRWLRKRPRNTIRAASEKPCGEDSFDIYCDQHVTGSVVYLWRSRMGKGPPSAPYAKELSKAFHLVSGRNTRRDPLPDKVCDYQRAICAAMTEASKMIRGRQAEFPASQSVDYEWDMPEGSLAGMLGPVEVRVGKQTMVVTVDPNDIRRWVVIPKPSRTSALKDVTNDQRKAALDAATAEFSSGRKLSSAPHASLNGMVATFADDKWQVGGVDWDQQKKVKFSLVQYPEWDMNFDPLPFECPDEYSQEVVQWAAGRIGGYEPMVHMPSVSRDGAGTKESLTGLEADAYCLLRQLSERYPDALWPTERFAFETRCIPLRLEVRERLLSSLASRTRTAYPKWSHDRKLTTLQQEALEGMLQTDATGMGNFLWMLVGSGKTMTVLSFIDQTRKTTQTVWCLPMSAMKSVAQEIRRAGWEVRVLASTSGRMKNHLDWASEKERTLNTRLKPGMVTLIEHDDVRNLVASLSSQMLSTTFVYDEVHKAMSSKTQRTGSALRLAQLAKQMVALTGTPIVDSRAFTLISWLRFCVPFQVHARNFWVAANSMIAKLTATPVQIDRRVVSVPLPREKLDAITAELPPRLGGTARKPNWKKAYALSVEGVDEWLAAQTVQIVYGKRGPAPPGCPPGSGHAWEVAVTRMLPPSAELFSHLSQRVLLVAADKAHAVKLVELLLAKGAPVDEVIVIGGRERPQQLPPEVKHASSVCFTAEEMRQGDWVPSICVAPISYCEGYSLTWMTTLITGVYPSNQAKRTQMEGRINRANCERMHRTYITAMAGLTEIMYKHQRNAKNLENALANLSKM